MKFSKAKTSMLAGFSMLLATAVLNVSCNQEEPEYEWPEKIRYELTVAELPAAIEKMAPYRFLGEACTFQIKIVEDLEDLSVLMETLSKMQPWFTLDLSECVSARQIPDNFLCEYRGMPRLMNIVLPPNIEVIGNRAFEGAEGISSIELPETLREILSAVFAGTSIESVELPASVEYLHDAFFGAYDLKTVKLNDGLKTLKGSCFGFTQIETLEIPDSVEYINGDCFYECEKFNGMTFASPDRTDYINMENGMVKHKTVNWKGEDSNEVQFYLCKNTEEKFEDPLEGIDAIGEYCFLTANNLREIVIPEGIRSLDNAAIFRCAGVKNISLPSTLEHLKSKTFMSLDSLESITFQCDVPEIEFTDGTQSFLEPNVMNSSYEVVFYVPEEYYDNYDKYLSALVAEKGGEYKLEVIKE